jgi:hypothetical protein
LKLTEGRLDGWNEGLFVCPKEVGLVVVGNLLGVLEGREVGILVVGRNVG